MSGRLGAPQIPACVNDLGAPGFLVTGMMTPREPAPGSRSAAFLRVGAGGRRQGWEPGLRVRRSGGGGQFPEPGQDLGKQLWPGGSRSTGWRAWRISRPGTAISRHRKVAIMALPRNRQFPQPLQRLPHETAAGRHTRARAIAKAVVMRLLTARHAATACGGDSTQDRCPAPCVHKPPIVRRWLKWPHGPRFLRSKTRLITCGGSGRGAQHHPYHDPTGADVTRTG
jgi:hypothetical protein